MGPEKLKKFTTVAGQLSDIAISKHIGNFGTMAKALKGLKQSHLNIAPFVPPFDIKKVNFRHFEVPTFKPFINKRLLESLRAISSLGERIANNPEMHFGFISNLEGLNIKSSEELKNSLTSDLKDEDIDAKEKLLHKNLLPLLEDLGLDSLWHGANHALLSNENPDRFRHCLVSLRTILEHLIDEKLVPIEELKDEPMLKENLEHSMLAKRNYILLKLHETVK